VDLAYYEAEMLQTAAQAAHCQEGAVHFQQQNKQQHQQQGMMKLPLYSETKGRKKHSAKKKSEHRAQIKAPPADRVVKLEFFKIHLQLLHFVAQLILGGLCSLGSIDGLLELAGVIYS
jgi:hypothetical protein